MRTSELQAVLIEYMKAKKNVLIVGAPGLAKTAIAAEASRNAKQLHFVMHPSISDPTDAKGMPFLSADGSRADFVPFGELAEIYNAIEQGLPCNLFLDDLGQATTATQASDMILMDKLRGKCSVIAATNRRQDKAGVSGLLEPVKSRFHTIINVEAHVDDFTGHMIDHGNDLYGFDEETILDIVGFLRFRPDLTHQFDATQDIVNQPSYRTWEAVGHAIMMRFSANLELATIGGAIGESVAGEFIAFKSLRRNLPNLDNIIMDPKNAPIPIDKLGTLWAVCVGLANKATPKNFAQIDQYAERLYNAGHGDYMMLLVRDCVRRDRKICATQAYIKLATGERGKFLQ